MTVVFNAAQRRHALIALPVPIAALVVEWVRPKRNLPAQVLKKK